MLSLDTVDLKNITHSEIASPSLMSYEGQRIHSEYFTFAKLGSPIDLKQSWALRNLGPCMSKWESLCVVHNPKEDLCVD